MKKLSRALMGVTALVMAFSASALVGCGDPKDGSIKGDYKEATPEQVTQTLETVNEEKILGDNTVEGYKFGLDLTSELSLNISNTTINTNNYTTTTNVTASFNADYKSLMSTENGKTTEKGAGSIALSEKTTSKYNSDPEKVEEENIKIDAYQDDAMAYVSVNLGRDEDDKEDDIQKFKVDVNALMDDLMGGIGSVPSVPSTPAAPSLDLSSIANLTALGAKISMDTSDGTKIKVSFDQSLIATIFSMSMPMAAAPQDSTTTLPDGITANKCALDIYLSLDKSNVFSAASVVIDLDVAIDSTKLASNVPTYDAAPATTTKTNLTTIVVKGFIKLKADDKVNPKIPANIATDAGYVDMTSQLSDALGQLTGRLPY